LFWLGHDFILALVALQYEDPREELSVRLKQCHYHSVKLGFGEVITQRLLRLKNEAETSLKSDWTTTKRTEFNEEISRLLGASAKLTEDKQNKDGDPFVPWEGYPEVPKP